LLWHGFNYLPAYREYSRELKKLNDMRTSRLLLLAAVGGAVALLLTTDKGKKIRKNITDNAGDSLASLKDMLSKEVQGLAEEARAQISGLLDQGTKATSKAKKTVGSL
jgi:gas vesicle protein